MSNGVDDRQNIFRAASDWLKRVFWLFGFCWLLIAPVTGARADDPATGFESANKLYEEGKYVDAVAGYDKLLASGNVSEAIYFNRGNALFKLGQVGRAIASYRQAQLLAPRDPELRANLQLARTRTRGGSPYRAERWRMLLSRLSVNEWAVLTSVVIWALFILLALGQWRVELKSGLRSYLVAACFAVVFFGGCLGLTFYNDYLSPSAIVVVGEVEVRNGPLDESQSIFKVRDGAELEVTDQKDGWLQVVDAAQRMGWLRQDQVITFDPGKLEKSKP